jgi:hypothetical protein
MAESVDFGFMDITLVFQKDSGQGYFPYREITQTGDCKD